MAMAAGIATLRFLQDNDLVDHARDMGNRLKDHLRKIQAANPSIGEVRGRGLMLGVEIVDPTAGPNHLGSRPCNPALAKEIQAECLRRGLILELGGRHSSVVRFLPPLIVTLEQIDVIAEVFEAGVRFAEQGTGVAV